MSHPRSRPLTGYVLSILASVCWAGTSPGIRYLITEYGVPRLTVALWRDVFIVLAIFPAFLAFRPSMLAAARGKLGLLAVTGAIGVGLYHIAWVYSVDLNGAALAVVLVYTYTSMTAVAAWLLYREPITRFQVLALVLSIAGCVLAVRAYDPDVLRVSWVGIVIGLATAVLQTFYALGSQRLVRGGLNPWAALAYLFLFGTLAMLGIILLAEPADVLAVPGIPAWGLLAMLGLGPTLGGYGFFNMALHHVPGKIAGLISVTELLWAALLAYFLLGETQQPVQIVGMGMVLSSTLLANVKSG